MKTVAKALLTFLVAISAAFAEEPINDNFAFRSALSGTNLTVTGDNSAATTEPNEPGQVGVQIAEHTLWYSWIAPLTGVVRVKIRGVSDQRVAIYRGFNIFALETLCLPTRDSGNVAVNEGDPIAIVVESAYYPLWSGGGGVGPFSLTLEAGPAPATSPNDNFADALSITNFPYAFAANLRGASREAGEPTGLYEDVGGETLWWTFTPTELGVLSMSRPRGHMVSAGGILSRHKSQHPAVDQHG